MTIFITIQHLMHLLLLLLYVHRGGMRLVHTVDDVEKKKERRRYLSRAAVSFFQTTMLLFLLFISCLISFFSLAISLSIAVCLKQ